MRKHLPSFALALLIAFAFCFYIPLVSYYGSPNEFYFDARGLARAMLVPSLCLFAASFILFSLVNKAFASWASGRYFDFGVSPVLVVALLAVLCLWLEGTFLNKGLPQITGEKDLFSSTLVLAKDLVVWFSVLGFGLLIWRAVASRFTVYAFCLGLILAFGIADAALWSDERQVARPTPGQVLEKVAFHSEQNVLVLILDAMSTALVQDFFAAKPDMQGDMRGFVLFENNLESALASQWSIPSILRGDLYSGGKALEYQNEAVTGKDFLPQRFASQGRDVYMTSTLPMLNTIIENDGLITHKESGLPKITPSLYGLLFIRFSPYVFKNALANRVGFTALPALPKGLRQNKLTHDQAVFAVLRRAVDARSAPEPTLHIHHLHGAHMPYVTDSEGLPLPASKRFTLKGLREQSQWTLSSVVALLNEMKANGIYDSSTILLLGDHGDRRYDVERENMPYAKQAALLIKPANSRKRFSISKAPTSNMYLADFLYAMLFEGKDLESLTGSLPELRSRFNSSESKMYTYKGQDVRRLVVVGSKKIDQQYDLRPLSLEKQYSFAMLKESPDIAIPSRTKNADYTGGWGVRLLADVAELGLPIEKKVPVNMRLTVGTRAPGGGATPFEPYSLTVRDLVSQKTRTVTISQYDQDVSLRVMPDDDSTLQLQISVDPFTKQTQILLGSIYLE